MSEPSDLLTIDQTMEALSVKTRRTIYNLVSRGQLHAIKRPIGQGLGGRRLYFAAAEVAALKARQEQPGAPAPSTEIAAPAPALAKAKAKRTGKRGGK